MKNKIALLVFLACALPLSAQQDTIGTCPLPPAPCSLSSERTFRPRQLIAPTLIVGFGAWGLAEGSPTQWLEEHARDDMNPHGHRCRADEFVQYVPTAAHLVLGFIPGTRPRHNFRDRFIASATANLLMGGITNTVKYTIKERRPDSDKRNSYFSGHTATAFTGAASALMSSGSASSTWSLSLCTASSVMPERQQLRA